jgi:hypothetical protein
VEGRALKSHEHVWLVLKSGDQCRGDPRLADAGWAREQHHLSLTRLGRSPSIQQERYLSIPAEKGPATGRADGLEPIVHIALGNNPPSLHWNGSALKLEKTQVLELEELSEKPLGDVRNDYRIGLCQRLKVGSKIRRIACYSSFSSRQFAGKIIHHYEASRDTDVCAQHYVWARPQIAHSRDQLKTNARGALDCVFLRMRITEIDQ